MGTQNAFKPIIVKSIQIKNGSCIGCRTDTIWLAWKNGRRNENRTVGGNLG